LIYYERGGHREREREGKEHKTMDDLAEEHRMLEARSKKLVEDFEKSKKKFLEELDKLESAEIRVLEVERKILRKNNTDEQKKIRDLINKYRQMAK